MKITAYNTLGTKESRVVVSYEDTSRDDHSAKAEARYLAAQWNRDETREDMRINFLVFDGNLVARV